MSYLRYLCFSLHIVASNTYFFLRLVYIMFPVSLECSRIINRNNVFHSFPDREITIQLKKTLSKHTMDGII
jgi:hypothetical protein